MDPWKPGRYNLMLSQPSGTNVGRKRMLSQRILHLPSPYLPVSSSPICAQPNTPTMRASIEPCTQMQVNFRPLVAVTITSDLEATQSRLNSFILKSPSGLLLTQTVPRRQRPNVSMAYTSVSTTSHMVAGNLDDLVPSRHGNSATMHDRVPPDH